MWAAGLGGPGCWSSGGVEGRPVWLGHSGGGRVTQDEAEKMGRAWRAMVRSRYFFLRSVEIQWGPGPI